MGGSTIEKRNLAGLWLEVRTGRLGLLAARRGLSNGVVSGVVGNGRGGRPNGSSDAPSGLRAVGGQLPKVEKNNI